MAINTRYPNQVILSDLAPNSSRVTVLDETGSTAVDGWDTVTQKLFFFANFDLDIVTLFSGIHTIGQQLDSRLLFLQSVSNFKCHAHGIYTWSAHYKGLASTKPVVVNYDAAADQQQGTNISTPDGTFESLATHENTPTASVRYVVSNIATAPTDEVGTASIPASAPSVAPSIWTSLAKFTYHYPNGWVLMASKTMRLPGTNYAFVDDRYQYIRAYTPRT